MTGRHRAPVRGGWPKRLTESARADRAEAALAKHGGDVAAAAAQLGEPDAYVAEVWAHLDRIGGQP